jgi:hypothetical protein
MLAAPLSESRNHSMDGQICTHGTLQLNFGRGTFLGTRRAGAVRAHVRVCEIGEGDNPRFCGIALGASSLEAMHRVWRKPHPPKEPRIACMRHFLTLYTKWIRYFLALDYCVGTI